MSKQFYLLHIHQSSSITGSPPSDRLVSFGVVLPHCIDAVGIFYSPNQLGQGYHGYDKLLLMMRLQFYKSEECAVFPHNHYTKVHFDPEWDHLLVSLRRVWKLFLLDKKTWNQITKY